MIGFTRTEIDLMPSSIQILELSFLSLEGLGDEADQLRMLDSMPIDDLNLDAVPYVDDEYREEERFHHPELYKD
jgi:hypothetical protein